ncbi:MAG: M23 family metallopeptidase [Clostridia bacterium]|nr:M23 family metallopeptidase [Clostridia bacterium]
MSQEKKTNKRKLLIRYLILAACILVIAAVTVTTVFAVNDWFRNDITIDTNKPDEPNTPTDPIKPVDPDKPDEPDKPTVSETTFALPVSNVNLINVFDFGQDASLGHWHFHTGVDMAAAVGTDVYACLDGTVESIVLKDELDGNSVTIAHANGLKTVYTYIEVAGGLKQGDTVKRGDKLGTVSEPTGMEFKQEAHLHFEVIENGECADPVKFLDLAEK